MRLTVRSAVRRGIGKVDALDRVFVKRAGQHEQLERLLSFYDTLRERFTSLPARPADGMPDTANVDHLQRVLLDKAVSNEFLRVMTVDGDFDRSLVSVVRRLIETNNVRRARPFAQVIQNREGMREIGDICLALVVMREPMNETAWELFNRNDLGFVLRLAPVEYFRVGFELAPDTAVASLQRLLKGEFTVALRPGQWLDIARAGFAVGAEDLAEQSLQRAEKNLYKIRDEKRARQLRADFAGLRSWFGRREGARASHTAPTGEVPVAVFDYQLAGHPGSPVTEGEAMNTLAVLGNLLRRRGIKLTGDADLVALAGDLQKKIAPKRAIEGSASTVHFTKVDRDASNYSSIPDGSWVLVSGVLMRKVCDLHFDLPFNPALRPVFLGVEIPAALLHVDGMIDYLKRYAPIGCRDWRTVFTLQAAGIPAFFSGWLTTTLDNFDLESAKDDPAAFAAGLPRGVVKSLNTLREFRAGRAPGLTSELRTYLAARAVGAKPALRPDRSGDAALDGLINLSDADVETLRQRALEPAATVLGAILDGRGEDEVYALWRDVNAPAVAAAEKRRHDVPPVPPPSFDVEAIVRATNARSIVVERSEPAGEGAEVNIEFSVDGNFKHPLDIVLESIVKNTSRPVRAFVLCRDFTSADFERMAKLFPTVSFVWLPTDNVDYGDVHGMLKHVTVATMDRLLLPNLLTDVDRIIHYDLDTVCIGDIGELFDVDMGDVSVSARDQRHPFNGSGYLSMINLATRARSVALSIESMQRLTTLHPFDFRNFNAGVMVLNLKKMREDDFAHNFLPLVERLGYNGQTIMNHYAGSTYHEFPRAWNAYPRYELVPDAKTLHFLGPPKAWHALYIEGQPIWREAERTFAVRAKAVGVKASPPVP
jgi:lipopolysaccharide biosynthesis glycosyltransferase